MDILSTAGAALGGDHLDQKLFETLLFPALGEGSDGAGQGMSGDRHALSLQSLCALLAELVHCLHPQSKSVQGPGDGPHGPPRALSPEVPPALFADYAKPGLRDLCGPEEGKRQLSEKGSVSMDLPELDLSLTLDRPQFEQLIAPELERFDAAVPRRPSIGLDCRRKRSTW